jgi:hypothetical protein
MRPSETVVPKHLVILSLLLAFALVPSAGFTWGPEGHHVVVILAKHYMNPETAALVRDLLGSESLEDASVWADEYRHSHPETGPWHYIDIPLTDSKIDMPRECPNGNCVIAKTEQFLAVLKDAKADRSAKEEALKYVIHFVGDMHQPLHDEDDGDKGGNARHVIFHGHPDNLHWVWDTGLLEDISRRPESLAAELESRITRQDQAEWVKGTFEDWVMAGHRLAQTVAYGDLGAENPAVIEGTYERQADPVIETQLEKAGVRLAYLPNANLTLSAIGQKSEPTVPTVPNSGNPDTRVWVNTNSGAYHCPGTRWYGKTKAGEYMTQKQAQDRGYHPAHNDPCP